MEEELEETSFRNRSTASRHHHHQRRRAKKPPPPPSTTNYDDVFGGPPRHAVPFSGVPDDYSEVFGGVSVSCSIPFLDLPTGQMDEWDYASGESVNGVDYGEIFGRCDFAEFAVPYEELFGRGRRDEGEMDMHFASANGRSSFKSRSGPQTIDPSVFIQEYSNDDTIPYLEDANFSVASEEIPMEYNTSYNKSSRTKELLQTTASVPQPQTGFTFVVEPDKPLPEHPPLVNEDVATHENTVKPNPRSSANSQSISNKELVSSGVPFLDVADVNLLTQSVNLPPPARPPTPKFLINERQKINTFSKTDSVSSFSTEAEQPSLPQQEKLKPFLKSDSLPPNFDFVPNLKLDKREKPKLKSRPITFSKSESLPPGFGSELDAMKEAMEFAQARLKTAKELHEKKREGKITELPLKKKHVKEENLEASEGEKPRVLRSISLASNFSKSREFMKVQVGVMATQGTHELEKSGKWISDEEFHELTSIEPTKEKGNKIGITVTEPLVETNRESVQINGLPPTEVGLPENLNTDVNATENLEQAREIKYSEDLKREEKATIGAFEILTGSQEPVIEEVPVITQNNFELEKETGEGDTEALKENANGIPNVEERENTGEVEGETEDGRGCKMKVGMETVEEDRNNLDEEMKRQRKKEELEKERQRENKMKEEEEKERAQKLEEEKERALQLEEEKEGAHKLEEEKERALQLEEEKERAHKLEEEKERKLQMEMEREEKERREQERIMAEEEERLERERIKKWEEESERERLEKEKEEEQRMLAEERERERKLEEERQEEKMREKEMVRKLEEEKERERKLAEEIGKERGRVRKLEEEREQERERVRRLEEEKQREREMALKLEKEKERERKLEEEIEKERGRIRKLEEEREQEREKVRKLEEERELERERVRKLEEEREQERERVRKLEEEREKERIEKEREQKEREQRERERIVKEREQKEMEKKLEAEKEKQRMEKEKEEREKQRRMEKEREEKEMAMRLEAERRRLERERAEEREKMTKLQGEKAKERKMEARKSDEEREREKRMKEKERKREGRKSDEEREKAWERKSDEERERERERRARKERGIEEREREREEEERKREREKDRLAVERATQERAERIAMERITAARQRAVENREKEEVNTRGGGEGFEKKKPKGEEEKKERDGDRNAREARLRAERAAVERATAEARERAIEKAKAEAEKGRDRLERFKSFNRISSQDHAQEAHFKRTQSDSALNQGHGESALRHKARLERQQRTAERAAKALAEKNRRDIMAQREQAERDRIAEHLDADVKRWSSGKEGNLRALLSTLQYILGQNSGWQPIHLTEVITAADVKKAYRKATLYVHPDKLQQRGASIQQKYICEKVFDLLKEAWNKFNSEER